jgi:ATP-binding protein involved in chromosome partitioning
MQEDSLTTRVLPVNFGPLKGAHAGARITGPCGDTMEFWIEVREGRILGVSYTTDGCSSSIDCGSAAACLANWKTLDEAKAITQADVLESAGNIPEDSRHCGLLAANTLGAAIDAYRAKYERPSRPASSEGECGSCKDDSCSAKKARPDERPEEFQERQALKNRLCRIAHKIIVLSGKGGVGKSTVALNLAVALSRAGKRVGLLDVDIHGPSIPTMLKTGNIELMTDGRSITPALIDGLKVMSVGFLMQKRDEAVIWRGPMKTAVIRQFLKDVDWGNLDYLVIDSPPGTGDEPLSLCQMIEDADGAVVVTTPQEVAAADVRKSINFCRALELPVLGIVENMSGFVCPKCGEVTQIFKAGGGTRMAEEFGIPLLGKVPFDPAVGEACDEGTPFIQYYAKTKTAEAFEQVIAGILKPTAHT